MLSTLVNVIFIFDGDRAPNALSEDAIKPFAELVQLFGFHVYRVGNCPFSCDLFKINMFQAPGEAEAELAALNAAGRIDAVLTEDFRAFLFGAITVIRP